jgi:uncharacterized lipoprotein YajG
MADHSKGGKIRAMRKTLWLLAFLTASSAFARGTTPKELLIGLKFKPQEGVASSSANLPPAMLDKSVDIRVKDGRRERDAKVIGQGTGGDDRTFPIRVGDNIEPFIKEALTDVAKKWGLKTSTSGDRILDITITRFYIDEGNKALGSVYSSEVKLAWALKSRGGKTLAQGAGSGNTHRYGRAHSEDNINEVLSDALKEAFANVLDDSKLQSAWGSGKKR